MRRVPFLKMQGIGNDFVVLDTLYHTLPPEFDFEAFAIASCDRHRGIGGDGLLLLCAPDEDASRRGADVRMRMWNPDGTEDMCGNGLRCIAALTIRRGYATGEFLVQTLAGDRTASQTENGNIQVTMGRPLFEAADIPMAVSSGISPLQYSLDVGDKNYRFITSLSTGSTHTVIFVDELPENDEFHTISPQIEHHPYFPERTTVLWTRVLSPNQVQLRIWERGVGETLACGTGACAAAVATHINGRGDATQGIRVYSKGGELHIRWQEGSEIHKTGPAEIVYTGTWIANEE